MISMPTSIWDSALPGSKKCLRGSHARQALLLHKIPTQFHSPRSSAPLEEAAGGSWKTGDERRQLQGWPVLQIQRCFFQGPCLDFYLLLQTMRTSVPGLLEPCSKDLDQKIHPECLSFPIPLLPSLPLHQAALSWVLACQEERF